MKREDLYSALSGIDDSLIEETAADIQRGTRRVQPFMLRLGSLAACLAVVASLSLFVLPNFHAEKSTCCAEEAALADADDQEGENYGVETAPSENDTVNDTESTQDSSSWDEASDLTLTPPEGFLIIQAPEKAVSTQKNAQKNTAPYENNTFCLDKAVETALSDHEETAKPTVFLLQIRGAQDGVWLDNGSDQMRELVRLLRMEGGYCVGYTSVTAEGESLTLPAGYFTADELEQLQASPVTFENFGYSLVFP